MNIGVKLIIIYDKYYGRRKWRPLVILAATWRKTLFSIKLCHDEQVNKMQGQQAQSSSFLVNDKWNLSTAREYNTKNNEMLHHEMDF